MERPVGRYHRNLPPIHHHSGPDLRLPRHFNDVPVLNKRIQFQINGFRLLALGNDRETVLLALHRFLPRRFVRLYHPVVRSFAQACNRNIRRVYFLVNQGGRKVRIPRDLQPVANRVRHRRPGELHVLGRLLRSEDRGHVRRRNRRRRPRILRFFHVRLGPLEAYFLPVGQLHSFAVTGHFAGALFHQNFVLIQLGIVMHLRRRFRSQ